MTDVIFESSQTGIIEDILVSFAELPSVGDYISMKDSRDPRFVALQDKLKEKNYLAAGKVKDRIWVLDGDKAPAMCLTIDFERIPNGLSAQQIANIL